MRRLWPMVYVVSFVGAALLGYREMAPERLRDVDPTIAFGCAFTFVLVSAGWLLAIRYAVRSGGSIQPPSWSRRFPLVEWRYDPLQFLFFCALLSSGLLFGSILRLPGSGPNGGWVALWFSSLLFGQLIGAAVGYSIYSKRAQTI